MQQKIPFFILFFLIFVGNVFAHTRDVFLDDLQKRSFLYFWELANTDNGLIPDRYPTPSFCSVAAVGFGLANYVVGVERGWITRDQAVQRILITLRFFYSAEQSLHPETATGYKGFFYHFLDMKTGRRYAKVELSTIDTTLLLAGILVTSNYFSRDTPEERELRDLAEMIYQRVDWKWAVRNGNLVSMGWHPETGFIPHDWKGYNEAMILYILALGAPEHCISENAWKEWVSTYEYACFEGETHVNFSPLFGHQYSHIFIDFRGIRDTYMANIDSDYFENSRKATYANRNYCIKNPYGFRGYGENVWGLTACDGPADQTMLHNGRMIEYHSYWARGASSSGICDDGTIAPTAAGGSIPFAPDVCIPCLKNLRDTYGDRLWGQYGFFDAFNLSYGEDGFFDVDFLGIDVGPVSLMTENYYTELLWDILRKDVHVVRGLQRAGFTGGWLQNR